MNNHGIHGVQDMCNLLLRRGKGFVIEAGHWKTSDVLGRIAAHVKAAHIVSALQSARVGLIGSAFKGMGDFSVEAEKLLADFGVTVVNAGPDVIASGLPRENDAAVKREMARDLKEFHAGKIDPLLHQESTRTGLALRRWIEKEKLTAFSLNFQTVTKKSGIPSMPFLEISKSITRGTGYAGEGDTLTAALNGAVASVFPETSFTEMFCADWAGERIFLSHMGEMNLNLAERKPALFEKEWTFTDAQKPICAAACFKPGKAVFFNLAPQKEGYALILAPVEMVSEGKTDKFRETIRGWMKPALPVARLLEEYSRAGGTHHAGLVYGDALPALKSFGRMMGFAVLCLD
jgi:L-arabinose isomerase